MFGTIRKHQTWLWAIIITLTIISFVIFFSPYSKFNSNVQRGPFNVGSINRVRITEEEFTKAFREAELQYFFNNQTFPDENVRKTISERDVYQWLLIIQKQEQLGVHVSTEAAAQVALQLLAPLQRQQRDNISPSIFVERYLQPRGFSVDDFDRFVRHYVGIQQLINTLGLSGRLVTPQEAKLLYIREHEELATTAAFFSFSNYLAQVPDPAPEALAQFFTNHAAEYRIPDRVQVGYVKFGISNYLSMAETELKSNLTEKVDMAMQQLGTNFLRYGKTPDEAKAKIRGEIIRDRALAAGRKDAVDFANPLFEIEPLNATNLEFMAAQKKVPYAVTEPFDDRDAPKDLDVTTEFNQRAFSRTTNDPFAGPIIGRDGVYVIAFKTNIPSELPALEKIRDQALADYKRDRATTQARLAGMAFGTAVTSGLAQGKSFAAICSESKVKPVELPPFSLSTRSLPEVEEHINLNGRDGLKQLAFSTQPGKASKFQESLEGGSVIYVRAKLPMDEKRMSLELPAFTSYVRQSRTQEAFQQWFAREASKGLRDTPAGQPRQSPSMSQGARKT